MAFIYIQTVIINTMEQEENDSQVRFEEEMGVHHAGNNISNQEVNKRYDFEVETEPVFKRLAEDIYQGREAGIREPLTNSVTSVTRAIEEGYLDNPSEGIIVCELYEEGNARRLTLRDNGVGITREELNKVVTQIGKSTSRSSERLTGKFGMGFLATWMLAGGTDGGFGMYSNPRGIDEGPFFGFWDNSGFSEMEPPKSSVAGLDENEYGVEFEIFVDQSISPDQLVEWIDKYAEWTRVPVLFRHHTEEGVIDEEYPPKDITTKYEEIENGRDPEESDLDVNGDDLNYYKVENKAFTAINSNLENVTSSGSSSVFTRTRSFNRCILMDVPIEPDWKTRNQFPLSSLEVRINYETPYVVDGPHKGNFVVSSGENPEEMGNNYIQRESLTTNDVVTPFPTGTRDYLQDETGFIEWLSDKMYNMYYDEIAENVRSVNTLDDYCELTDEEVDRFHEVANEITQKYGIKTKGVVDRLEDRARTSFSQKFREALPLLQRNVSLAPEGNKGVSRKNNRKAVKTSNIVRKTHLEDDKRVFMSHRITQDRAEFVWAAENEHFVVRVSSNRQQAFEDAFGWESLSDLDFSNDLDLTDEKRKEFTDDSQSVEETRLTLHIGNYGTTKKIQAKDLKEKIKNQEYIVDNDDNRHYMSKLIIFDRTDDNISHNKDVIGSSIGTVSVNKEVYKYLKDVDNVWTADIIEEGITIPLSNGNTIDIPEDSFPEESVFHIVDKETAAYFRDEEIMNKIQNWIRNNEGPENAVYIPLTTVEKNFSSVNIGYREWTIETQNETEGGSYKTLNIDSDVELYVRTVLDEEGPEYDALKTVTANWSEGGKELIDNVTE